MRRRSPHRPLSPNRRRGRSPRPKSRSPSPDRSVDDIDDDNNTSAFTITKSDISLFGKCFIFSIIATYAIFSYTNPDEIAIIMEQWKHDITAQSMHVTDSLKQVWKTLDIRRASEKDDRHTLSPSQPEDRERSDRKPATPATDEAVIYTIEVPPQCRVNYEKCYDLLTPDIIQAFEKDGVVALRGLLTVKELNDLKASSNAIVEKVKKRKVGSHSAGRQFYAVKHHALFDGSDGEEEEEREDAVTNENGFRNVALYSVLPHLAQLLMRGSISDFTKGHTQNVRVIRDVFLAKDQDPYHCGWHVDDTGFWPSIASFPGINAWVAIDDMPLSTGGGFALSIGSHTADWRYEAYNITGSTFTLPEEGYKDAPDMFNKRGVGTCNIKNAAPHLHRKMEEKKRVYDVREGDVILHTRWLFHRTVPFEWNYRKTKKEKSFMSEINGGEDDNLVYRRYSIRYSPGNAILPKGYGTELSLLHNPDLQGKALDRVTYMDGPWYPKCWPSVDQNEIDGMKVVRKQIKIAEEIKKQRMKEMKPYLQEIGRQQRKKQFANSLVEEEKSSRREKGNGEL